MKLGAWNVANRGHYLKGRQPSTEVRVPSSIPSKPCKWTIMQFGVASPKRDAIIAIEISDICSLPAFTCQKLSAWIGYYEVTFCCQQRMILRADPKAADLMQPRRFSQRVLYAWGNPGNNVWSILRLKCARPAQVSLTWWTRTWDMVLAHAQTKTILTLYQQCNCIILLQWKSHVC